MAVFEAVLANCKRGSIMWTTQEPLGRIVTLWPLWQRILAQALVLTPVLHDRETTPTRGWWKITSLQATGK